MARIAIVVGNSVPDSYCEALGEAYARVIIDRKSVV